MSMSDEAKRKFQFAPAIHFTLIKILPNVLEASALRSKNRIGTLLKEDLSNSDIQRARSERIVDCADRTLHDFVPLYFGLKMSYREQQRYILFSQWTIFQSSLARE